MRVVGVVVLEGCPFEAGAGVRLVREVRVRVILHWPVDALEGGSRAGGPGVGEPSVTVVEQ
jgi:hypothetical protein